MPSKPPVQPNKSSKGLGVLLLAAALVLTIISYFVAMASAVEEPYFSFEPSQAFVQVGIATSLITLWIVWALMLVVTLATGMIHWKWSLALLWAVVAIFYLSFCPSGYLYDMQQVFFGFPEANS